MLFILLEKNLDKVSLGIDLSENPNAIHLLEKNLDKINWNVLSCKSKCNFYIRKKFR
jgi:hypothetical protein